jgi:hypothetical protein
MSNRDVNPSQGFGATRQQLDWGTEESYWRDGYRSRPYASADRDFDYYRPGYRYGFESANRHRGREWDEVEAELRAGWEEYEHRGDNAWSHMKDAVRDAWNRVAHG